MSVPFPDDLELLLRSDAGLYSDLAGTTPATADGTAIALWQDQSGNFNHLAQPTSGARPVVKTNQINGLPCVRFDGVDDFCYLTNAFIPAGYTAYAVVKVSGVTVKTIISGRPLAMQWRIDALTQRLVDANTADIGFATNPFTASTWTQINVSWDFTTGIFRQAGTANGSVSAANHAFGVFRFVGAALLTAGLDEYFAGDLACLMIYSGLHDTNQRQAVEAWITAELGV
jgi:hypothetical protein